MHGLPRWPSGKEATCQCRRPGFYPCIGKILWRRKWQPFPVFLPGKFQEQRSLAGPATESVSTLGMVRFCTHCSWQTRIWAPFFRELLWPSRVRLLLCGPPTESPPEPSVSQLWANLSRLISTSPLNQLSPANPGEGHCRVQAIHLPIPKPLSIGE